MRRATSGQILLGFALFTSLAYSVYIVRQVDATSKRTQVADVVLKASATRTATRTATWTLTPSSPTLSPSASASSSASSSFSPTPTLTPQGTSTPYPSAPLCPDSGPAHDNSTFHTLWNGPQGCHYDHEHGENAFTAQVDNTFPGFDLIALLGGSQVGHTNPSSSMENTHKHGGNKWDVTLSHSSGCIAQSPTLNGVDAFVIQYHNFGDYSIEMEARVHSAAILMRQCRVSNPTDYGYVYVVQHQDYGQRLPTYQSPIELPYPDAPVPDFDNTLSPYLATVCFGGVSPCTKFPTRQYMLDHNANTDTTWVSVPQAAPIGSTVFAILFRARDTFQALDGNDLTYPFTFAWMCSADGGLTYSATPPCRYNNTTSRVHELHGELSAAWDGLTGFDTDARVGRITADGYLTAFGDLNTACTSPGPDCFPIKMFSAFVGEYDSAFALNAGKGNFAPENLPERDVYFCAGLPCAEGDAGAVPSGWVGSEN